jgi:hypothetical protein
MFLIGFGQTKKGFHIQKKLGEVIYSIIDGYRLGYKIEHSNKSL